jgi:hypothetical protein
VKKYNIFLTKKYILFVEVLQKVSGDTYLVRPIGADGTFETYINPFCGRDTIEELQKEHTSLGKYYMEKYPKTYKLVDIK